MTGDARPHRPRVTVSIVSHGHGSWLPALMTDLASCLPGALEVVLTLNVPEPLPPGVTDTGLALRVLQNRRPRGFGANHNAALLHATGERFCILNPDVRVHDDPFPALMAALESAPGSIVAPRVFAPEGALENSARPYPTPGRILFRLGGRSDPPAQSESIGEVDWVAGMFMLLDAQTFLALGGFDERYFLYYEDVDLCARARLGGGRIFVVPSARIVHAAQRASHRKLRFAWWHARSMLRFFTSPAYRDLRERGWLDH